jgi:hypothetical protein
MDQSRRNNFKSSFVKSTGVGATRAPIEFNMSAMDFPVIESTPSDHTIQSTKSTKLNYKAATIVQTPSSSESTTKIIPQGCVEYTFNKQTKQIMVNYAKDYPHETTKTIDSDVDTGEEYLYCLQRALATNWNMHNENYIECYGIDAYVRTFMIPGEKNDYDYERD